MNRKFVILIPVVANFIGKDYARTLFQSIYLRTIFTYSVTICCQVYFPRHVCRPAHNCVTVSGKNPLSSFDYVYVKGVFRVIIQNYCNHFFVSGSKYAICGILGIFTFWNWRLS